MPWRIAHGPFALRGPGLHWFDERIAAELRLWDAIDQQRLSPFVYFGIHDGLDLR